MHFTDKFKITVDKETKKIRLSIKVNEDVVNTYYLTIAEFQVLIAQFQGQIEEVE